MTATVRKSASGVPARYFRWEAAGLRWLGAAVDGGGAPVARVLEVGADHLDLERLEPAAPTTGAAEVLGRGLAATHDAGATAYGVGPDGWEGDGYLGPLEEPLPLGLAASTTWGAFHAEHRIRAVLRLGRDRGTWSAGDARVLEALAARLERGELDDDDRPARLHGDLWSGNVLWTKAGAVLLDPAAHGGHRETDLAMLALFGAPHLDRVRGAYAEVHPLAEGWRERVPLHQAHPLMLHAVLFGGGYAGQAVRAAGRYA
ncbi:MAG TPA: fructosamine kinase family protein [Dermatophilaceae bacterium]|nr:fructosamine kinase family protein [Dermatophilaceae bacterium]